MYRSILLMVIRIKSCQNHFILSIEPSQIKMLTHQADLGEFHEKRPLLVLEF